MTAAALMIGLALVTFVSVLAAGVKASIDDTISNDMKAQFVVQNKDGFSPISPETGDAIKRVPGVRRRLPAEHLPGEGGRCQRQAVRERDRPAPRSIEVWDLHIDKGPPNVLSALRRRAASCSRRTSQRTTASTSATR